MEWVSNDIVSLIYYLLPGFATAWVFYGLTAHPKAQPFERVIQALIFTVVVQFFVVLISWVFLGIGHVVCLGNWTSTSAFVWSVLLAFALGLLFAYSANNDLCHTWLRRFGITVRTSFPSEWYSAFSREKRWVVIHLPGGRRLHGWPEEWPDQPDAGHFLIDQPTWLLDNGDHVPLYGVGKILVSAAGIQMVEFLKRKEEIKASTEEVDKASNMLIELVRKEGFHGK